MKRAEFQEYKLNMINRFKDILADHEPGYCDEQGLPSYTNPNPMMRWLTWKRVNVILSAIGSRKTINSTLDFGCGYGVFIPYLLTCSKSTVAFDLMIAELKSLGDSLGWENISYLSDINALNDKNGSFDLILAIEVLEHIDDLEGTIKRFYDLLEPGGRLLIAGPTENFLYKTGRKLAGYSGEYHMRNIYAIRTVVEKIFRPRKIAAILPVFTFYEVYECVKEQKYLINN